MLRRNNDCINAHRAVVVVVFNSHLTLRVGTQISHHLALTANFGKHNQDFVRQRQGEGHERICFLIGITKHHTLVARTLIHGVFTFHTAVDVGTLFVDGRKDTAAFGIKLIFRLCVTNALDSAAHNRLKVSITFRLHFAGNDYLTRSHQGFTSHL